MIDVLLVSPRLPPTHRFYSGEQVYTETLLACPPPGVRYHFYEDLLSDGRARKLKWLNRLGPRLVQWGILAPDLWAEYLVSDVVPDLVHVHAFSLVIRFPQRARVPVVMSCSIGSVGDLRYYLGWDEARVRRARRKKEWYLRLAGAYDTSLNPQDAARVLVWSEFARQLHLEEGRVRPEQIEVLPPGIPLPTDPMPRREMHQPMTFLFIGKDFVRKNGLLMLEAFRRVRAQYPGIRLILVGIPPDDQMIVEEGITHYRFLPRAELYQQVYPQADVLVLPSKVDGFGLVLLEAMAFGLPVIGVNAWAMPEIVQDGQNGYLIAPDSLDALVQRMSAFVRQPDLVAQMGARGQKVFAEKFSVEAHNRRLKPVYEQALAQATG